MPSDLNSDDEEINFKLVFPISMIRLGCEVTFTRSRKRVEKCLSDFYAISLALGAVSFKKGHVLGGGQVPVQVFARVSQSASECCPERGRMPSLASVGSKSN
jgi:hypothetical protein